MDRIDACAKGRLDLLNAPMGNDRYLRIPSVQSTNREGQLRVDMACSPSHRRTAGVCAFETFKRPLASAKTGCQE
jgi:hypothetical protein